MRLVQAIYPAAVVVIAGLERTLESPRYWNTESTFLQDNIRIEQTRPVSMHHFDVEPP